MCLFSITLCHDQTLFIAALSLTAQPFHCSILKTHLHRSLLHFHFPSLSVIESIIRLKLFFAGWVRGEGWGCGWTPLVSHRVLLFQSDHFHLSPFISSLLSLISVKLFQDLLHPQRLSGFGNGPFHVVCFGELKLDSTAV